MRLFTYTQTHIYTHIHTYIYIYIHIYRQLLRGMYILYTIHTHNIEQLYTTLHSTCYTVHNTLRVHSVHALHITHTPTHTRIHATHKSKRLPSGCGCGGWPRLGRGGSGDWASLVKSCRSRKVVCSSTNLMMPVSVVPASWHTSSWLSLSSCTTSSMSSAIVC